MFEELPYSEKAAKALDEEAKQIVDEAYQRTLGLLRQHKDGAAKAANVMLSKETITYDDVLELVGPPPLKGDPQYEEFVSGGMKHEAKEDDNEDEENYASPSGEPLNPVTGLFPMDFFLSVSKIRTL
jgi:hypothetical protein